MLTARSARDRTADRLLARVVAMRLPRHNDDVQGAARSQRQWNQSRGRGVHKVRERTACRTRGRGGGQRDAGDNRDGGAHPPRHRYAPGHSEDVQGRSSGIRHARAVCSRCGSALPNRGGASGHSDSEGMVRTATLDPGKLRRL
jgi:hypothetical protein